MGRLKLHPDQLTPGIRGSLMAAVESNQDIALGSLAQEIVSDKNTELYPFMGQSPSMVPMGTETSAGAATVDYAALTVGSYRLTNITWAAGLVVHREELEDDQSGGLQMRINDLATEAAYRPTKLLYERMVNSDALTCYDGVTFFNNAHPARKNEGGTQDNIIARTGGSTSNFSTDLNTARSAMLGFRAENGELFHKRAPRRWFAVVPSAMEKPAMEAINAQIISNTSNVQLQGTSVVPIVAPELDYLGNGTDWYLFNGDRAPFIYQRRRSPEVIRDINGSFSFETHQFRYQVNSRFNVGFRFWQDAIKVAA